MKTFKVLVYVFILVILFSCSSDSHKFFDIKYEDVNKVSLHWKQHHYTNEDSDYYVLEEKNIEPFVTDFNDLRPTLKKDFNSCYEVVFEYIDNTQEVFKCDGELLKNPHNSKVYKILLKENIITKYWGIRKRDFCLKKDKLERGK